MQSRVFSETGFNCATYSSPSIAANRHGNTVLFHHQGGVDVGDVDAKAARVEVDIEDTLSVEQACLLVKEVAEGKKEVLVQFLQLLYKAYSNLYFTLLEINPLGTRVCACVCARVYILSVLCTIKQ